MGSSILLTKQQLMTLCKIQIKKLPLILIIDIPTVNLPIHKPEKC